MTMTTSDAEDTVQSIVDDLRAITETPWKRHCDNIYEVAMMGLEAIDAQEEIIEDLKEKVSELECGQSDEIEDLTERVSDLESQVEDLQATIDELREGASS